MTTFGDIKMRVSPLNEANKIQTFWPLNFVSLPFFFFTFFIKMNFVFLPQPLG